VPRFAAYEVRGDIELRYGVYWLATLLTARRPVDLDEFKSRRLYPDVSRAGLSVALQAELDAIDSDVQVSWPLAPRAYWSRAAQKERIAQVSAAAEERAFDVSLSAEGVMYLDGWTAELSEVAAAFDSWFVDPRPRGDEMAKRFPFLVYDAYARVYERGGAIEYAWLQLLERDDLPADALHPLIELASEEPKLRRLFPFISLDLLCFSRWVGWPFSGDLPYAAPRGDVFRVHRSGGDVLGEGNVSRAVELLVAALPEPLEVVYRRPTSAN
jgi:hypothetical protein